HVEVKVLQSFSVAPEIRAELLSVKDTHTILLTDMKPVIGGLTEKKIKNLKLYAAKAQPAAVGLSAYKLIVADTQGILYRTERSNIDS
ncbi:AvrE-family type 3 secretion system effector, partial [Pseudomonas syringae pv. tagetis]|uniref:AvrE-family type 3 secretion system effector n=1 Tax=Pseudomonas syringae group genomosp. 7 TaxID=251699 RepID=UPI00376F584C